MELVKHSRIGIWGLGKTGWAAVRHFKSKGFEVWGMDRNPEQEKETNIPILSETNIDFFCKESDYIFSSPGVQITSHYAKYAQKWINECDYFQQNFNKKIIAITGSVGKTSTIHLLSGILNYYKIPHILGGNIGTALFELLDNYENQSDLALLELSSFQLEHAKFFAPDIAIITNLYPNHLDRHKTFEEYSHAKWRITALQKNNQHIIMPQELGNDALWRSTSAQKHIFFNSYEKSFQFPLSFGQNWQIIQETLSILQLPLERLHDAVKTLTLPDHRLEYVGDFAGVSFYNDSKSTLSESTLAAVNQFLPKKPILFLGGESKGVDRSALIEKLQGNITHALCFGKEALQLHALCCNWGIPATAHESLSDAFNYGTMIAKKGDIILFSPSGSSYDLFKNYIERGNYFKQLVNQFIQQKIL